MNETLYLAYLKLYKDLRIYLSKCDNVNDTNIIMYISNHLYDYVSHKPAYKAVCNRYNIAHYIFNDVEREFSFGINEHPLKVYNNPLEFFDYVY